MVPELDSIKLDLLENARSDVYIFGTGFKFKFGYMARPEKRPIYDYVYVGIKSVTPACNSDFCTDVSALLNIICAIHIFINLFVAPKYIFHHSENYINNIYILFKYYS